MIYMDLPVLQDVNEFAPQLIIPDSTITIVETRIVGSILTQVSATDGDNPTNQPVSSMDNYCNLFVKELIVQWKTR